jgi:hypothetical protein
MAEGRKEYLACFKPYSAKIDLIDIRKCTPSQHRRLLKLTDISAILYSYTQLSSDGVNREANVSFVSNSN